MAKLKIVFRAKSLDFNKEVEFEVNDELDNALFCWGLRNKPINNILSQAHRLNMSLALENPNDTFILDYISDNYADEIEETAKLLRQHKNYEKAFNELNNKRLERSLTKERKLEMLESIGIK